MKRIMIALTGIVLASLFLGCAQTQTQEQTPRHSFKGVKDWTADEHREAASMLQEEIVRLEDNKAQLEQRVEHINKNQNIDPKNSKRRMLKSRIGTYNSEIEDLREEIAWHNKEADRIAGSLPSY